MNDHSPPHVSDSDLIAYVQEQLTSAQREATDQHLETCLNCRRRLLDHANFQNHLREGLAGHLEHAYPNTNWSAIASRIQNPPDPHRAKSPRPGRRRKSRRPAYTVMAIAYAIILIAGGLFLFRVFRDLVGEQQTISLAPNPPVAKTTSTPVLSGATITSVPTPDSTPTSAGPPIWDGSGRVNLLVMGIDQRRGQEGYWRTDTMLILTVDPAAKTMGMISIPRDLWVPIWAYDIENRINTAHYYGDLYDYPGGGPALARDTVAYNLGIPIHHYVRLNFSAFEKLIDEIGGIDIYAEKAINDPLYPDEGTGYDPFYLAAGQHHLDGKTALKYARSRHGTGDFDRAKRQQQVILAARDQVINLGQLPRLIANGPDILKTLGDSVRTDLTVDQATQLAHILNDIPREAYQGAVIDQSYTQPYTTSTGAQVLIPMRDKIAKLYESFFQ